MAVDPSLILAQRPDVLQNWLTQVPTDKGGTTKQQLADIGVTTPETFATWWFNNLNPEGWTPGPATPVTPPTPVSPGTPTPTVQTPNPLNDMIQALIGQFTSENQRQQQLDAARTAARDSVYSGLGTSYSKFAPSILDTAINDILGKRSAEAQEQLDRGKARGMYNDVGYNAGLASLNEARGGIQSKLQTTADDILNGYRSKYDTLRSDALGAANTFSGVGTFDLTPWLTQANDLVSRASAQAPGAFQAAIGNDPLFDLADIRGDAGTAQGALNLKDMNLMDALAKRKKVDTLGRGIGSQGAF